MYEISNSYNQLWVFLVKGVIKKEMTTNQESHEPLWNNQERMSRAMRM